MWRPGAGEVRPAVGRKAQAVLAKVGREVLFVGEALDGDDAAVRSKVVTMRNQEIPFECALYRVGSGACSRA